MARYRIKDTKWLYDKWMRLCILSKSKVTGMYLFQNNADVSSAELNQWYVETNAQIAECEKAFQLLIIDMRNTVQESVNHITANKLTK